MKLAITCILFVAVCASCGGGVPSDTTTDHGYLTVTRTVLELEMGYYKTITRIHDKTNNIVCYVVPEGISCVKVAE